MMRTLHDNPGCKKSWGVDLEKLGSEKLAAMTTGSPKTR
jgi:hypothetical protein